MDDTLDAIMDYIQRPIPVTRKTDLQYEQEINQLMTDSQWAQARSMIYQQSLDKAEQMIWM